MSSKRTVVGVISVVCILAAASYGVLVFEGAGNGKQSLITYSADAYVQESSALLASFHNSTGFPVAPAIGGGSFADARAIAQGAPADIFISVAQSALTRQYLLGRYSGWAVAFAADQLVIAYNHTLLSAQAKATVNEFGLALSSNNTSEYFSAFSNLTSGNVKVGIANPVDDPAGLRGWLALEIAGYLYAGGNTSYFTNMAEINNATVSSTNAATLVTPLETGNIQFLFIYKSAAVSHGLDYISLPPGVNQGNASLSSFYGRFTYPLPTGNVSGSPIYLYVTVLANTTLQSESYSFLGFVVNNTQMLSGFGLTPLQPSIVFSSGAEPPALSALIGQGRVISGGPL